nr:ATP-binding cassette domain-containing protein [Marinicella sp. W31]MDC2875578.1 ATP-binding cassette domain-containing protein [Marinicella sp. W31]
MNTVAREPLLEFKGLGKSFFGVQVVKGVDLALAPGEILCLVGENGAGKSTMMNMLGGVHIPDEGKCCWLANPIRRKSPRMRALLASPSFIRS